MFNKTLTDREKGILALILLSIVFASMGLFARYLATGFFLFQQVYLRMFSACIVGYILFRQKIDLNNFKKISTIDWLIIILRAVSYSLFGIILFTQAILIAKYSNVSFISSIPMTAVLGFIILKEKFTFQKLIFIVTAFLGVLLISLSDYSNIFIWGRGELLTLISTFFFAISYIARKWQTDKLNNFELTFINFFVAFIVVFIAALLKGEGIPFEGWHLGLIFAVIGAGIFNILNVFLTNYGFQKVDAVLASDFYYSRVKCLILSNSTP